MSTKNQCQHKSTNIYVKDINWHLGRGYDEGIRMSEDNDGENVNFLRRSGINNRSPY